MTNGNFTPSIPLRLLAAVSMLEVFTADRILKFVASEAFREMNRPLSSLIDVTYHENSGLIANLPVPLPIIILIVLTAVFFVGRKILELPPRGHRLQAISLGLILGGALGNLFDRIVLGHVIDWILLGGQSVINIADLAIAIGAILYVFSTKRSSVDSSPEAP